MQLSCRRRRCRALMILALCGLCILYVIGTALLELKNAQAIREEHDVPVENEAQSEPVGLSDESKPVPHESKPVPNQSKPVPPRKVLDGPDYMWMKDREDLLRITSSYGGRTKVLLYSYMRGGSTVFSNVFNVDPEPAVLWYEALDAFHAHFSGLSYYSNPLRLLYHTNQTRRSIDDDKLLAMTKYIEDLLNCRSGRLPLEALTHRFIPVSKALKGFWNCTKDQGTSMYRIKQLVPSASCEEIEFDEESDLRIVRCREVFRFLRKMSREQLIMGDRGIDLFHRYLDQMGEDNELRRSAVGRCGTFWKFQLESSDVEFMDYVYDEYDEVEMTTKAAPSFQFEQYCQTILSRFSQFLKAAWYTRFLSEQTFCRDVIDSVCSKSNFVVAGIHRASMADLELLIQRMPDVHFVYYVRDPRAIAVSRADPLTMLTYVNSDNWTAVNESEFLCRRMWDDIEARKYLERRYPGSILTVRYEDFLLDPRGTVTRMYSHFQRHVPRGFDRWVNETLHAGGTYDGIFGIRRLNSMEHISKWRSKVSVDERREMTRHCSKVLKHFGYLI